MKPDQISIDIIKKHFTADSIENEISNWNDAGYKKNQEVINLKEAYKQLTGINPK